MKNKVLSPTEAVEEYIRQDVCGTLAKAKNENPRMSIPFGRLNLKDIFENCLECSAYELVRVKKCHITDCPLYPFRMGTNPNRKGIGNKNAYLNLKNIDINQSPKENITELSYSQTVMLS
ncbi:MAG: hypothetical protein IPM32_09300 [Ignavibacteriae bacterium]|nr:hypothetical protein [Ignavibacteriota bacterium]